MALSFQITPIAPGDYAIEEELGCIEHMKDPFIKEDWRDNDSLKTSYTPPGNSGILKESPFFLIIQRSGLHLG